MMPPADNPVRGKIIQFPGVESHCYIHDTFDISQLFAPEKKVIASQEKQNPSFPKQEIK